MVLDRTTRSSHITRPVVFTCEACGVEKPAHRWQRRRYCSLSCANRGRARKWARPAPLVVRNTRIVRLHRERLKAPAILTALVNEQSGQWDEYRVATTRLTAASV